MTYKNNIKTYFNLNDNLRSIKRQYGVFFIVGIISFVLGILFLKIFYKELGFNLITSNTISFILVSGINFILSINFVFLRGRYSLSKEILLFYIIAALSLLLDNILLYYFVDKMGVYYIFAKFITVFIISFITFALKKLIIFKK